MLDLLYFESYHNAALLHWHRNNQISSSSDDCDSRIWIIVIVKKGKSATCCVDISILKELFQSPLSILISLKFTDKTINHGILCLNNSRRSPRRNRVHNVNWADSFTVELLTPSELYSTSWHNIKWKASKFKAEAVHRTYRFSVSGKVNGMQIHRARMPCWSTMSFASFE